MERSAGAPSLAVGNHERSLNNAENVYSTVSNPFLTPSTTSATSSFLEDPGSSLRSDHGTEADFHVENNPFAFTPGQLNRLLNPKSLSAFWALGGLTGISRGLQTDTRPGLSSGSKAYGAPELGTTRSIQQYLTKERSVIPLTINGSLKHVLPDTGVSPSVISLSEANAIGAPIEKDPAKQQAFNTAVGNSFKSCGTTRLSVAFPDDPEKIMSHDFTVVEKCAAPIVLGRRFLEQTELYKKFRHRLVRAALHVKRIASGTIKAWRLMLMESNRRDLGCFVDTVFAMACIDTGADADFVSLSYALAQKWQITRLPDDEGFVILADESVVKVTGYADKRLVIGGRSVMKRFYILDGLSSDVVLGDDTVEEFDLLGVNEGSSIVTIDSEQDRGFQTIQWVDRYNQVEDEVQQILSGHQTITSNPSSQHKLRRFLGRARKTPSASDVSNGLRRQRNILDSEELRYKEETAAKMLGLTGAALEQEKKKDEERRARHRILRAFIHKKIEELTMGALPGAASAPAAPVASPAASNTPKATATTAIAAPSSTPAAAATPAVVATSLTPITPATGTPLSAAAATTSAMSPATMAISATAP